MQAHHELEKQVIALCAARGAGARICPLDAARELASGSGAAGGVWHALVPGVRRAAVALASAGHLVIYYKGHPADPAAVRGDYRFGLARCE